MAMMLVTQPTEAVTTLSRKTVYCSPSVRWQVEELLDIVDSSKDLHFNFNFRLAPFRIWNHMTDLSGSYPQIFTTNKTYTTKYTQLF